MQVYTFSTNSCIDNIYLDKLSSSKEGVKKLLKPYVEEWYLDSSQEVRDIFIDDCLITVVIDDFDLMDSITKVFSLIIFEVD